MIFFILFKYKPLFIYDCSTNLLAAIYYFLRLFFLLFFNVLILDD